MKKVNCFIAMAFRKDLDNLYNNGILPVLKDFPINCRRVDRIVHNERIDSKIRKEIEDCKIAIVDLTYARPSVYWEAGFAERISPVIYTCREDHFVPKEDDEFGNYKIHFDLQNANIIPWDKDSLDEFREQLKKRIELILNPIIEAENSDDILSKDKSEFDLLSTSTKESTIQKLISDLLPEQGYISSWYFLKSSNKDPEYSLNAYSKIINDTLLIIFVSKMYFVDSFTKIFADRVKKSCGTLVRNGFIGGEDINEELSKLKRSTDLYVKEFELIYQIESSISIRSIRRVTLIPVKPIINCVEMDETLSTWKKITQEYYYYYDEDIPKKYAASPNEKPLLSYELFLIDNINSPIIFKKELEEAIRIIENETSTMIEDNFLKYWK